MQGLVKTHELPTLVASPSDHYVVVEPAGKIRFASVEEGAHTFMIPQYSPTMAMLRTTVLEPIQAVTCLGRSIHVGVAHTCDMNRHSAPQVGPILAVKCEEAKLAAIESTMNRS